MMPALTALATSAASALAAASSGPFWMLRDQLHEMTVGFNAAAAANAAVVLTRLPEAFAHLTGSSVMSGAVAKMLADSPVPWPTESMCGSTVPGPSTVGSTR